MELQLEAIQLRFMSLSAAGHKASLIMNSNKKLPFLLFHQETIGHEQSQEKCTEIDYKLIKVQNHNRKQVNVAYQRLKKNHKTFLSLMDFVQNQLQGRARNFKCIVFYRCAVLYAQPLTVSPFFTPSSRSSANSTKRRERINL